jgi:AhpD family alkylhydroperoxidase
VSKYFRHITPVGKRDAEGVVSRVYKQSAADLGRLVEPIMILSPAPDILASYWALMREANVIGQAPRAHKEAVAAVISQVNSCPWCAAAHTGVVYAAGDPRLADLIRHTNPLVDTGLWQANPVRPLLEWAAATRTPGSPALTNPPFPPEHAAEYIGTALTFHFLNRMVSALLVETFLPANRRVGDWLLKGFAQTLKKTVRRQREPGTSLDLVEQPAPARDLPAWAVNSPTIGTAVAALKAASLRQPETLSEPSATAVAARIGRWDGNDPGLGPWIDEATIGLRDTERPAARLALLAAITPYRITDDQVTEFRRTYADDSHLVRLLAWGAMLAVQRIESWISHPTTGRNPHTTRDSGLAG